MYDGMRVEDMIEADLRRQTNCRRCVLVDIGGVQFVFDVEDS